MNIDVVEPKVRQMDESKLVTNFLDIVNNFQVNEKQNKQRKRKINENKNLQKELLVGKQNRKLSIISPKLFSLFPDSKAEAVNRVLSPTLLSFQRDGFFSLPDLFRVRISVSLFPI